MRTFETFETVAGVVLRVEGDPGEVESKPRVEFVRGQAVHNPGPTREELAELRTIARGFGAEFFHEPG